MSKSKAVITEDNLYPTQGEHFQPNTEPEEQSIERQKEKAATLQALPVLQELVEHFDERIEFRNQLSSVEVDLEQDPALHQKMCAVNQLLAEQLRQEKQFIEDLLEVHFKK